MGAIVIVWLLVIVLIGSFLFALSVAALVKVLQIAEDLRYLRSKSDLKVDRPKPHANTVGICAVVAIGLALLAFMFLVTGGFPVKGI